MTPETIKKLIKDGETTDVEFKESKSGLNKVYMIPFALLITETAVIYY